MKVPVHLNQIETEVPPFDGQAKFLAFLPHWVGDERRAKLIAKLASKTQIEKRHSVLRPSADADRLDDEGFFVPGAFPSTERRMNRYREAALPLAAKPVARILAETAANEITHLIVTSCTGFYAPGLDLELQRHFGLRSDLQRTIIGFMGCYAAFNGLRAAAQAIAADPRAKVLMVNLELCSLHLQDVTEPERVLGSLQFADGCAASLISSEPRGLRLERFRSEVLSNDVGLIEWNVTDSGFDMRLSTEVPEAIARALPGLLPRLMSGEERARMKHWAIHPGGRAILDAVQRRLELTDEEMLDSREVLRNFGNMSSATIVFVLRRILESAGAGLGTAMAFGPGLTVESLIFTKDPA